MLGAGGKKGKKDKSSGGGKDKEAAAATAASGKCFMIKIMRAGYCDRNDGRVY